MNELLNKRIANLLSVKSLVTIALTATFCILTVRGAGYVFAKDQDR